MTVAWWAGLTVDHLYENCPNRLRAEKQLRRYGWWDVRGDSGVDPAGDLVCGMCAHRYAREQQHD